MIRFATALFHLKSPPAQVVDRYRRAWFFRAYYGPHRNFTLVAQELFTALSPSAFASLATCLGSLPKVCLICSSPRGKILLLMFHRVERDSPCPTHKLFRSIDVDVHHQARYSRRYAGFNSRNNNPEQHKCDLSQWDRCVQPGNILMISLKLT